MCTKRTKTQGPIVKGEGKILAKIANSSPINKSRGEKGWLGQPARLYVIDEYVTARISS